MTENMKVWNAVKQPPASALKTIRGGRLSGMTDVNPQWRYQVMTEQFGMCGVGWSYEVVRVWNEPLQDGQVLAFAEILLHVGDNAGIPGIGGSMLVTKESSGLHASDEGYKMAITDALSVAMKMLGVGADIYAGLWDGTKYKDQPQEKQQTPATSEPASEHWCEVHGVNFFKKGKMKGYAHPIANSSEWCNETEMPPVAPQQATEPPKGEMATTPQVKKIFASAKAMGYKEDEVRAIMVMKFKVESTKLLTKKQAGELIEMIERGEGLKDEKDTTEKNAGIRPEDIPY